MSLFAELKRRNVIRMAGLYLVGAWMLAQVAETVLPVFDIPTWVLRAIMIVLALGFVPALIFAWVFELTPEGIKRDHEVDRTRSIAPQTGQRMNIMIATLLSLGLAWYVLDKFVISPTRDAVNVAASLKPVEPKTDTPEKSIAVLPFVNMSSDPDQEYFSDGIAEELLNRLAQLSDLKVAARTSAFQFKGKNEDIGNIGRQLKVAHVLEGSVRKSGTTLRITAQLIDSRTGYHLWSETFDRDASDIFKVQDEIAGAIAEQLKISLDIGALDSKSVENIDPKAYDEYLRGRNFLAMRRGDLDNAIAAFDRSIALAPGFSAAYSGKAFAIQLRPLWSVAPPSKAVLEESREEANKALQLDPDNAEAYMVRGMAAFYAWNPIAASEDLERAMALAPGSVDILNMFGDFSMYLGDLAGAELDKRKAMALDPLSFVHPLNLADVLLYQGRFEESIVAAKQAIALGAGEYGYDRLTLGYLNSGQTELAKASIAKTCELSPSVPGVCGTNKALLLAAEAHVEQALPMINAMAERLEAGGSSGTYDSPSTVAWLYAWMQDFAKATAAQRVALDGNDWFPNFAIVYASGGSKLPEELSTDPQWLAVWSDPRIKSFMDVYRNNLLAWRAGKGKP